MGVIDLRDRFEARRAENEAPRASMARAVERVDAIHDAVRTLHERGHDLPELTRALCACADYYAEEASRQRK